MRKQSKTHESVIAFLYSHFPVGCQTACWVKKKEFRLVSHQTAGFGYDLRVLWFFLHLNCLLITIFTPPLFLKTPPVCQDINAQ